jgi:predicted MFS family arabinose efflux permease
VGFLAGGVLLLATFVAIQARSRNPLLPLPIVLERNRGGSFLALGVLGAGMFGVFLFLTYYLQQNLGYSPLKTGLAFLPLTGALVITSGVASTRVLPRTGPRPLFAVGMALAAVGLALLAQLGVQASYATEVLPGLILVGAGLGLVFPPATNIATSGVKAADAGVASALVNTAPQIGGSIGTALLSTLAASATSSYLAGTHASANLAARAAVHGYTTAFWWSAGIFAAGALITGLLVHGNLREPAPRAQSAAQPLGAV